MQDLYSSYTTFHPSMMPPGKMRLNWLTFENTAAVKHVARFRHPAHEADLALMHRPITVRQAYQWLGMMLGAGPPAVIFARLFHYGLWDGTVREMSGVGFVFLLLMMNAVCAFVGYLMGGVFSQPSLDAGRKSYSKMILLLALFGVAWGVVTGGSGGFFFFGIGAFFGMLFAVPVGIVAFLIFGSLHRWLERGGMIDARHFWPLAVGIVSILSTLIATR